jgi:hypothetical protein
MASNGTSLPIRPKTDEKSKTLNRADEVDDVSGQSLSHTTQSFKMPG